MTARILVVEDEPAIAESVAYSLRRDGFATELATTVAEAEEAWTKPPGFTLVVLDLMLPDGSGLDLIHERRRSGDGTPIIVLSSRDDEMDRVSALEAGADDYVTKPFSPREVVARIRAVLRRVQGAEMRAVRPRSPQKQPVVHLDEARRRLTVDQVPLELTRVEFDVMAHLMGEGGRVLSRQQLINRVWGDGFALSDRTIDSHIKSLRRKLSEAGGDAGWIETVRGIGYRFAQLDGESP